MRFEPNLKSLKRHPVPQWFHNAKLGIFIHWGLYSVPAYASTDIDDMYEFIGKYGIRAYQKKNPYAEWYLNSLRIEGSATHKHHLQKYGSSFEYDDFIPEFNQEIKKWNPDEWTDLFKNINARYVVITTKHHDGFLLWPSKHQNTRKKDYCAARDLVGELTASVEAKGLRMGFYYSSLLDWSFTNEPFCDAVDLFASGPTHQKYFDYVYNHWMELIERYEPSILWGDIGYPPSKDLYDLFAEFYNRIPDGVVNDRWKATPKLTQAIFKTKPSRMLVNKIAMWLMAKSDAPATFPVPHCDFITPEYTSFSRIKTKKWEATRGIGHSFGFNREEGSGDYASATELIHLLIDVVSKNGNLLLNVGPMADGTIPEIQKECLLEMGRWLDINGEAIFDTRPWIWCDGKTRDNVDVRFTCKGDTLYAIILGTPKGPEVILQTLPIPKKHFISLLGYEGRLEWKRAGGDVCVTVPENLFESPAYVLKIE